MDDPCQNEATCFNFGNSEYNCTCEDGWRGFHCEIGTVPFRAGKMILVDAVMDSGVYSCLSCKWAGWYPVAILGKYEQLFTTSSKNC